MTRKFIIATLTCCLASATVLADAWQDLATYKYGATTNSAAEAEKLLVGATPEQIADIESKLIAVVSAKEGTEDGKAIACRFLQRIGTEKCIPAVAALLTDDVLSDYARLVLERLPEKNHKEMSSALRDALGKASPKATLSILAGLGTLQDDEAVKQVSRLADGDDAAVTAAAMTTLGRIGSRDAARALRTLKVDEKLESQRLNALVTCAINQDASQDAVSILNDLLESKDKAIRIAALAGILDRDEKKGSDLLVKAIQGDDAGLKAGALTILASEGGSLLTATVCKALSGLPATCQPAVIDVLGMRNDRSALPVLAKLLQDADDAVRTAAIVAVARMGDPRYVTPLLEAAVAKPASKDAVIKHLALMPGDEAQQAMVTTLKNKALCQPVLAALTQRGNPQVVASMFSMLDSSDAETRKLVWSAIGALATDQDLKTIVAKVVAMQDSDDLGMAVGAMKRAYSQSRDRSAAFEVIAGGYAKANDTLKADILSLGASSGSNTALKLAQQGLASGNATVYGKALRGLASWPNAGAAAVLLQQAGEAKAEKDRLIALRGYIQLTSAHGGKKKIEMYKAAAKLVERSDEKKLIIGGLRNVKTLPALEMLMGYAADEAVTAEAELAASSLAWDLRRNHLNDIDAIARKLAKSQTKAVAETAQRLVKEIEKKKPKPQEVK